MHPHAPEKVPLPSSLVGEGSRRSHNHTPPRFRRKGARRASHGLPAAFNASSLEEAAHATAPFTNAPTDIPLARPPNDRVAEIVAELQQRHFVAATPQADSSSPLPTPTSPLPPPSLPSAHGGAPDDLAGGEAFSSPPASAAAERQRPAVISDNSAESSTPHSHAIIAVADADAAPPTASAPPPATVAVAGPSAPACVLPSDASDIAGDGSLGELERREAAVLEALAVLSAGAPPGYPPPQPQPYPPPTDLARTIATTPTNALAPLERVVTTAAPASVAAPSPAASVPSSQVVPSLLASSEMAVGVGKDRQAGELEGSGAGGGGGASSRGQPVITVTLVPTATAGGTPRSGRTRSPRVVVGNHRPYPLFPSPPPGHP